VAIRRATQAERRANFISRSYPAARKIHSLLGLIIPRQRAGSHPVIQVQHKSREIRPEGHFIGLLHPPLNEDLLDLGATADGEHFVDHLANKGRFK
jgi:hypothetical protein